MGREATGLQSAEEIEQADEQQAADGTEGGQQPHKRTERGFERGHKENLKGRTPSVYFVWMRCAVVIRTPSQDWVAWVSS